MEYLCCCCISEEDQNKPKFRVFGRKYKKFNGDDMCPDSVAEYEERQTVSENVAGVRTGCVEGGRNLDPSYNGYNQGKPAGNSRNSQETGRQCHLWCCL